MSESSSSAMKPFEFKRKDNKFMVLDHRGRLYFVDLSNKDMSEFHDTGPNSYQAIQYPNVKDYVDLGDDGETLYHYSPGSTKRITGNSEVELRAKIFQIFQTHVQSTYDENFTRKEDFDIFTSEWSFSIDNRWVVRYRKLKIIDNRGLECKVYYCRTPERLIQLRTELGLHGFPEDNILTRMLNDSRRIKIHYPKKMDKVVGNHRIQYFDGELGDIEVFVKRIPINGKDLMNDLDRIRTKFSRVERVVKHLRTESDEKYYYYAYEKMDMDLPAYIAYMNKNQLQISISEQGLPIVRGIVEALKELHSNEAFHHNFASEHVLLKISSSDVVVKLCGLGSSILTKKPFILDKYLATEKLRLGKTLWNLLSNGKYKFKEDEIPSNFVIGPILNPKLEGLEPIPADLIRKLVSQNIITLEGMLLHPIFWNANTVVTFIEGVSERLSSGDFNRSAFNNLRLSAFGKNPPSNYNWLLEKNQAFKEWFISMNDTYEGPKRHKIAVPTTWQGNWQGPTFEKDGVMCFNSGYNTTNLCDLVKLIRNTANHPLSIYPATNKASLHQFVSDHYPHMLMVVYNFIYGITDDYFPTWC